MDADKSLVVIHDTDFKRTANNSAYLFQLDDKTTQSISGHESHKFQDRYNPTYAPYLSDILELFTHYPKAQALVEIKRESLWYWGGGRQFYGSVYQTGKRVFITNHRNIFWFRCA